MNAERREHWPLIEGLSIFSRKCMQRTIISLTWERNAKLYIVLNISGAELVEALLNMTLHDKWVYVEYVVRGTSIEGLHLSIPPNRASSRVRTKLLRSMVLNVTSVFNQSTNMILVRQTLWTTQTKWIISVETIEIRGISNFQKQWASSTQIQQQHSDTMVVTCSSTREGIPDPNYNTSDPSASL